MDKTINYSFDKKKAIQLCKKAISGKVAIMKDGGDVLKVGAPMMTATIKITDNTIEISGSGPGSTIAATCASEIEMAVEEYQESLANQQAAPASTAPAASASAPAQTNPASAPTAAPIDPMNYLEYQEKVIGLLKQYKELFDAEIITEEEFSKKKDELLNFMKGMSRK